MRRTLGSDRRGSVVTIFAFSAMVLALVTALVMNQVSFYLNKRRLQGAVDMAALIMLTSGDIGSEQARALIASQIDDPDVDAVVTRGRYTPDSSIGVDQRFVANATPFNALQVDARVPADAVMMAGLLPGDMELAATARSARRQTVSVVLGSRLVRVEGGLSAALLDATLGYKGKLTVMDYESLASAELDTVEFLQALNVEADIEAVTFDDVLDADVTMGEVIEAMAQTTDDGDILALLSAAKPAPGLQPLQLDSFVDLGSVAGLPIDALTSGKVFPLSVGEVLAGSAALSDGDHQIALDLASVLGNTAIANVKLHVGEKPQILRYTGKAEEGASVSTSQLKLDVGALGKPPLSVLAVDVQLASAGVTVDDIACMSNGTATVKLVATTEAAKVGVKAPLLPKLNLALGSGESKTLTFNHADITAQTYKPVRSGLGLQVGKLNLTQLLLIKPVDKLLEDLGLHIAEADVKVIEADCGAAGLVH